MSDPHPPESVSASEERPQAETPQMLEALQAVAGWVGGVGVERPRLGRFPLRFKGKTASDRQKELLGFTPGWRQEKDWPEIAAEIRLRKTLILDAATDLAAGLHLLREAHAAVDPYRFELQAPTLTDRKQRRPELDPPPPKTESPLDKIPANVLVMAATDVFVEKAQKKLTDRATFLGWSGAIVSLVVASLLLGAACYLSDRPFDKLFDLTLLNDARRYNQVFTLMLLRSLTVSGLFLGGIYFLVMIARALLHESMVLLGRRHSLRFGRLYVYSKLGHVNFDEMERAFAWTGEHESAFADIRGDKVSKTLVHAVADVAKEVAKSTATAVTEAAKLKSGRA